MLDKVVQLAKVMENERQVTKAEVEGYPKAGDVLFMKLRRHHASCLFLSHN